MQVVNPEQGILQVYKNLCRAVIDLIKKHLKSPCLIRGSSEDRDRCLCSSHPACDSLGAVGESRLWMRAEVWRAISSCQIVLGSEALRLQQDSTRHSRNPVFCCRLQNIFRATWPFVGSASWCLLLRASCFSILDDTPSVCIPWFGSPCFHKHASRSHQQGTSLVQLQYCRNTDRVHSTATVWALSSDPYNLSSKLLLPEPIRLGSSILFRS